jgi:nucleoside-diphosphate-sugar epimerase
LCFKEYELTLVDDLSYGYLDNLKNHDVFENFIELDVRSDKFIELALDFDYIFHFAGISSLPECEINPYEALDVNTRSVAKLLRALRRSKKSPKLTRIR